MSDIEGSAGPNPKKRGLGRGLNALFDDEEEDIAIAVTSMDEDTVQKAKSTLGIDQLQPGAGQPRRVFDEDALSELSESIKQHGVLQPLLVRALDADAGQYEIIAGERRWRAAQKARLHELPVIVLDISDVEAFEIALIENLQREDLDPIDEALGFQRLMDEHDYTQEKLAKALGKSRSYIANISRLLSLPQSVQQYVREGALSGGHARALITADNPEKLAKEVISKGLSVRETEKLVSGGIEDTSKSGKSPSKVSSGPSKGPDVLALEDEMTNRVGMRVSIDSKDGKSGTVSIAFKSLDQMDELMWRLSGEQPPAGRGMSRLQD